MIGKRFVTVGLIVASLAAVLCGCSSNGDMDPNYSTEVKLTEEQKAKEKEIMSGQTPPGGVPGGGPGGAPGAVDRNVMGKKSG